MRALNVLFAFLLIVASARAQGDVETAIKDRQQFPAADWWRYYYITTGRLEPGVQEWTNQSLRFVIASMTPKQQILEKSVPVQLTSTLSRIDILEFGWDRNAWLRLMAKQPYYADRNSMMVRGDWLLLSLIDQTEAGNYYALIFGDPVPKTRDEALQRLGVNADIKYQLGLIEGASRVSLQKVRFIRSLTVPRGYAYGTFDINSKTAEKDPLETPNGSFKHDGEEWIIGLLKTSIETGDWCTLQVYFLANGQQQIVDRAPADLVEDHTRFRGLPEIRAAGGCFSCHGGVGLQKFTRNEFRETIESGVRILAQYEDAEFLERFHLSNLDKEVERNSLDYTTAVELVTKEDADNTVEKLRLAVDAYDEDVTLEKGSLELGMTPEELIMCISYYNSEGVAFGTRISSWPYDGKVPRKSFEESYLTLDDICGQWRQLGGPTK